jgi:hypothetical protein
MILNKKPHNVAMEILNIMVRRTVFGPNSFQKTAIVETQGI